MKKVVQFTEKELEQMLLDELTKGSKFRAVKGAKVSIEFVMSSRGVSALVMGVERRSNVQEPDVLDGVDEDDRRVWAGLKAPVQDTVRVMLDNGSCTLAEMTDAILEELEELGWDLEILDSPQLLESVSKLTEKYLQELVGRNLVEIDEKKGVWQKVKKKKSKPIPKVTTMSTAAQILKGDGGAMGRGEALEEGASEGKPRQGPKPRRRKKPRGSGGRGGPGGPGFPFQW